MKKEIELIRYIRNNILDLITGLSTEELNKIPVNFNNNIAWNLGHLVITQQVMAYKLGCIPIRKEMEWFNEFVPGSKPERQFSGLEIKKIKEALILTIDLFEQDNREGLFNDYRPWDLHGVMDVGTVADAVKITCVHEGRHYGVISCLVKLI